MALNDSAWLLSSPPAILAISFSGMVSALLMGAVLSGKLKEHHISSSSIEILKASRYVLIGLVALTLGQLIASAKDSFEETAKDLRTQGSQLIVLDNVLSSFLDRGIFARQALHRFMATEAAILHVVSQRGADIIDKDTRNWRDGDVLKKQILSLPANDSETLYLKRKAIDIGLDIISTRWRIYQELDDKSDDQLLYAIIFWSSAIFFSLGLVAPRNELTYAGLVFAIICTSYAIFIIAELESPYRGILRVSAHPLDEAIRHISNKIPPDSPER